jgi:hypothetical protein
MKTCKILTVTLKLELCQKYCVKGSTDEIVIIVAQLSAMHKLILQENLVWFCVLNQLSCEVDRNNPE